MVTAVKTLPRLPTWLCKLYRQFVRTTHRLDSHVIREHILILEDKLVSAVFMRLRTDLHLSKGMCILARSVSEDGYQPEV
jgi:hypothetical protein